MADGLPAQSPHGIVVADAQHVTRRRSGQRGELGACALLQSAQPHFARRPSRTPPRSPVAALPFPSHSPAPRSIPPIQLQVVAI
ncbi:unnamed protein product [Urochloa humidicola]